MLLQQPVLSLDYHCHQQWAVDTRREASRTSKTLAKWLKSYSPNYLADTAQDEDKESVIYSNQVFNIRTRLHSLKWNMANLHKSICVINTNSERHIFVILSSRF